jgi:hypothetical protein
MESPLAVLSCDSQRSQVCIGMLLRIASERFDRGENDKLYAPYAYCTTRERRRNLKMWWKIVLLVLTTLLALFVATTLFLNRGLPKNDVAIDELGARLMWSATLHSPWYWLTIAAILAVAGWLVKRWLFIPGTAK